MLVAGGAHLGEKDPYTASTVWLVLVRGEAEACQVLVAVVAGEALSVPGLVTICHPSSGDNLSTPAALGSMDSLIAAATEDVATRRDEGCGTNVTLADEAGEAVLMPLPALVLHLLHAGSKHISTTGTC